METSNLQLENSVFDLGVYNKANLIQSFPFTISLYGLSIKRYMGQEANIKSC